jgi:hypothetical protein
LCYEKKRQSQSNHRSDDAPRTNHRLKGTGVDNRPAPSATLYSRPPAVTSEVTPRPCNRDSEYCLCQKSGIQSENNRQLILELSVWKPSVLMGPSVQQGLQRPYLHHWVYLWNASDIIFNVSTCYYDHYSHHQYHNCYHASSLLLQALLLLLLPMLLRYP